MRDIKHFTKESDLIFIHGWAMNASVWGALVKLLPDRYRLHCLDLPGHGLHAGQEASADFSDWVEVIAKRVPANAVLVAWSLGGMLAIELAQRYPDKVSHLILIAASPKFVQSTDWLHGMSPDVLNQFIDLLEKDVDTAIKNFLILQVLDSVKYSETLQLLRPAMATARIPEKSVLRYGLNFLSDLDLRSAFSSLHCPVLTIYGQHDHLVSQELKRDMHGLYPAMRSVVIAGSGHAPFLSHTAATAQAIIECID